MGWLGLGLGLGLGLENKHKCDMDRADLAKLPRKPCYLLVSCSTDVRKYVYS
jgi:hypothetical protein